MSASFSGLARFVQRDRCCQAILAHVPPVCVIQSRVYFFLQTLSYMDALIHPLTAVVSDSLGPIFLTHLLTGCCQGGVQLATVIALGGSHCTWVWSIEQARTAVVTQWWRGSTSEADVADEGILVEVNRPETGEFKANGAPAAPMNLCQATEMKTWSIYGAVGAAYWHLG